MFALGTAAPFGVLSSFGAPSGPRCSAPRSTSWAGTALCDDRALPSLSPVSPECQFVLGAEVTAVSAASLLSGTAVCCVQRLPEVPLGCLTGWIFQTQSPGLSPQTCFSPCTFPLRVEAAPFQLLRPQTVQQHPPPEPPSFCFLTAVPARPFPPGETGLTPSPLPAPSTVPTRL